MPRFNEVVITDEQLAAMGYYPRDTPPPKPKFGRVKPVAGDKYWLLTSVGGAYSKRWGDDADDKALWLLGNAYLTREAAELAIKRQQAKVRVIDKLAELKEHELDWGDTDQVKYTLLIDHEESVVRTEDWRSYQFVELELYSTINACEWVAEHMADDVRLMLTGVE